MKNKLNLIVCFVAIFTLSSCHLFNDKEENKETNNNTPTVEGISQEIKNKIAAQDTLMNTLVLKVDTLAQALTQAQKENAELKAQIEKLESPKSTWGYMTLASFIVAIIALVLSFLRKGVSREKVDEIFSYNLDKSKRIAELKVAVSQLQSALNNNRVSQSVNTSKWDTQTLTVVISLRRFLIQPKKVVFSQLSLKVLLKESLTSFL